MIVDKLKEACNALGWHFNYGAHHWQNLQDFALDYDVPFEERQKYFLLLWQDRELVLNEYGAIETQLFECEFVFCVRSQMEDQDYNFKYQNNIKGLKAEALKLFEHITSCDGLLITKWRETEIENVYDTNLDGIKVTLNMTYHG